MNSETSARKLARTARVDALTPIDGADSIEAAHIGGWPVVVKKGEFQPGSICVYFEIDSFLPSGCPAWQFLVDKSSREFEGRRGHVLRAIKLRGQLSQGLLLSPAALPQLSAVPLTPGQDVTDVLGVLKYERPVPAELSGIALGMFPSCVPKSDQERIQNLAAELSEWACDGETEWEITEKLEGSSCTFAWLEDGLHVCSRNIDLADSTTNSFWAAARALDIERHFQSRFRGRRLALQGELVGPGIQDNIYALKSTQFFLYNVYDIDEARWWLPSERQALAQELGVPHVPVVEQALSLRSHTMASLLAMADGPSALRPQQAREGLVFKARNRAASFKAISNAYLLKQKG